MTGRASLLVLSTLAAALSVATISGARRVAELESHERDLAGEILTLSADGALTGGGSRSLLDADLQSGEDVTFELCSGDAMDPAIWAGPTRLEIVLAGEAEPILDATLEPGILDRARRSSSGACLVFGHGTLTTSGRYTVRLAWDAPPAFAAERLRARILVRGALGPSDGNLVFSVFVLSILLTLAGALRPALPATEADPIAIAGGRVALGVGIALTTMTGFSMLAPGGSTWGLISGLGLGLVEIGAAIALSQTPRADRIGWGRGWEGPDDPIARRLRAAWAGLGPEAAAARVRRARAAGGILGLLVVAPIAGFVLRLAAIESLARVPSTGEAPIEAFVSRPSGMLSFALIAVVAPVAEEVFFRGLVFGAIHDPRSRARAAAAFLSAWLLFGIVHLPQTWGNWGGLLAIVVAGLILTALRATFRSTLVSALAHLVYNGLLAAMALASAIAAT